MGTYTTNYSFFMPEPSVDKNWGLEINTANWTVIDTLLYGLRDDFDNYMITTGGTFDTRLSGVESGQSTNAAGIAANVSDIATNAANILTNDGLIATNISDITTLQGVDTALNALISTNIADIATNVSDISDHRADFLVEHDAAGAHTNIHATDLTLGVGVSAYAFPNSDGSLNNVLVTDGAGTLAWGNPEIILDTDTLDVVTTRGNTTANTIIVGNVNINSAFSFPTTDGTLDQLLGTNGAGVLSWRTVAGAAPTLDDVVGNNPVTNDAVTVGGVTIDDGVNDPYVLPTQDSTGNTNYVLHTDGAGTVSFGLHAAAYTSIADAGVIITATDVEGALQENRTAIDLNTTHRTSNGSDHGYIDQDVTSGSSPTFDGNNFTGIDADDVDIADAGGIITATDVEGALQENRTALDLNTTHRTSNGSDHGYIDQDVTSGSSPTFDGNNFTGMDANDVDIADAGGIITATDVEGALQENRTALDLNTTHRTSNGTDHGYIDQDVTSGSSPTFDGNNFTGVDANDVDIADVGTLYTATDVEGALQENRPLINSNTSASHARSHTMTSTSDHTAGNWDVFYTNGSGQVVELSLGSANQVLTSNGAAAAPTFETPASGFADPMTTRGDIIIRNASNVTARLGVGTNNQVIQSDGTDIAWATLSAVTTGITGAINFIIDGGGSAITTGVKGDLQVPFGCTITDATVLANESGSIVVDIWKDTYANYPPTVADTITAAAKPTLSGAIKSTDGTLTGWTTSVTAGDTLRFNVDSITTCTRVTVILEYTRT